MPRFSRFGRCHCIIHTGEKLLPAEIIEWIQKGQGFLAIVWFGSSPTCSPPLPSVSSTGDTQQDHEKKTSCWRERGGRGWARSGIIRTQEYLVLYKLFNTLWLPVLLKLLSVTIIKTKNTENRKSLFSCVNWQCRSLCLLMYFRF